ncbi:MAG: hypothetical protein GKR96_00910 [Gammaproteobacteria bacterium]|nr:hypothetical protein [Gammaproteobacteria bacterium]
MRHKLLRAAYKHGAQSKKLGTTTLLSEWPDYNDHIDVAYCYLDELVVGDEFDFNARRLDYSEKSMYIFMTMYNLKDQTTTATPETPLLNVDHKTRESKPYDKNIYNNIYRRYQLQTNVEISPKVGHPIAIRR